jgi:uncharacterized protein (TIGR03437 family)
MSISLKVVGRFALFALLCTYLRLSAQSVWFEPNQGQVHRSVEFLARSGGGYVYFGRNRMAVRDVRMDLIGANRKAEVEFDEPTGGISSYFIGRTEKDWHTGIPHYARVRYKNVYSGIDLVYYNSGRDIEYDFVLRPGADPNQIRVAYNKPVQVDENGDLLIAGLRLKQPRVYQNGREIACEYLIGKSNEVHLALAEYDHSQALTVDPVLEFSTYLGGVAEESGFAVTLDSQGNVYVVGGMQAPAAPDLNPFQQTTALINSPVVFKMTPDGRKILYYAFVGNGGWDQATSVAIDADGSAVIHGDTRNTNFPLKNAFQTQYKAAFSNTFITKLSPDGKSLVYSSYIGGSFEDFSRGVALDRNGNAWITGYTYSNDFTIKQALQSRYGQSGDCYVAKVAPNGDLLWSTYLGGSGADWCEGIAMDQQGNAYIGGGSSSLDFPLENAIQTTITPRNSFPTPLLVKLSNDGTIVTATFVGGPTAGTAWSVALDPAGNVFLAGGADSALVTKNAFQAHSGSSSNGFVLELDNALKNVIFATYLGGSGSDRVTALAVDQFGSIYLTGTTSSADFPVKGSLQSFIGGSVCQCDAFVAKFAPGAQSLIYSTLLGGNNFDLPGNGVAVDGSGNLYVTGSTRSTDFPVKNAFQGTFGGGQDIFFTKISDNTPLAPSPLTPNPGRVVFRYTQGGAAPTPQVVAVSGPAFTTSASAPWLAVNPNGSNVTVSVNPAGLAPNTYNASVNLTPQAATSASIEVTFTVLAPPPVLTSVNPALVPMGSNDTTITVNGSGFISSSMLQVDGIAWLTTPVQFVDASTMKFSMPANYFSVQYNHTIAVQNPQSDLSNVLSVSVGVPAPLFTSSSVVNAASYVAGAVAPGEIVTVFGSNFGTQSDTQVSFDNVPATLVYVTATQLAATVPYSVAGAQRTVMVVTSNGVSSTPVSLNVTDAVPAIFTADASGKGQAAALNQDNSVNGASNPASVGSVVAMYGTGGGSLTTDALPRLALPVTATVGGMPAVVYYAGVAPGLVQGAMQINVLIPDGVTPGPAVPVAIIVGGAAGNTVTLAIR